MAASNYLDNHVHERGYGTWTMYVYNPSREPIGPYEGNLFMTKDFHWITCTLKDGTHKTVLSVPSQNVSYVEDEVYKLEEVEEE